MLSDNSIVENNLIYVNYIIECPQYPETTNYGKGGRVFDLRKHQGSL